MLRDSSDLSSYLCEEVKQRFRGLWIALVKGL
jgi:hypothetical protein